MSEDAGAVRNWRERTEIVGRRLDRVPGGWFETNRYRGDDDDDPGYLYVSMLSDELDPDDDEPASA